MNAAAIFFLLVALFLIAAAPREAGLLLFGTAAAVVLIWALHEYAPALLDAIHIQVHVNGMIGVGSWVWEF